MTATAQNDQPRQFDMKPAGAIPVTPESEQIRRLIVGAKPDTPRHLQYLQAGQSQGQSASDTQVGGTYYKDMAIQPWDVMEAWMTPDQFNGFLLGSALAYIARFNTVGKEGKGGRIDIAKAQHYLQKWLEVNPE